MNRKFLAVVPAVLFALATHTAEYQSQPLILNIVAVMVRHRKGGLALREGPEGPAPMAMHHLHPQVALVPKLPGMTGVRLFGINKY